MKIMPTMAKGVVFVHEDGKTFEMAPLQVFISGSGQTAIRIGNNVLFFTKDGHFDGTESHVDLVADSPEAALLHEAFVLQGEYKGMAPEVAYFTPGTPGYEAETRSWSAAKKEDGGDLYVAMPRKPAAH